MYNTVYISRFRGANDPPVSRCKTNQPLIYSVRLPSRPPTIWPSLQTFFHHHRSRRSVVASYAARGKTSASGTNEARGVSLGSGENVDSDDGSLLTLISLSSEDLVLCSVSAGAFGAALGNGSG